MKSSLNTSLIFSLFLLTLCSTGFADTIWFENWETGWNGWYADNGLWQVGVPGPDHGPTNAYSGDNCAGTVLNGNYNNNTTSRLICLPFEVPSADQQPRIKFFIWHRLYSDYYHNDDDFGYVQVKVNHPDSSWQTISNTYHGYSPAWCQSMVDISRFGGLTVQVAFCIVADEADVDAGMYIDDISLIAGHYTNEDFVDFETGWDDWWYAENGVWQIGAPGYGPDSAYSGAKCAGTILNYNYYSNTSSRLISPPFTVDIELPWLYFQEWHQLYSDYYHNDDDFGYVQVKVCHPDSSWRSLDTLSGYGDGWSQHANNLSDYVGRLVQVGFLIVSDEADVEEGWYIDDVILPVEPISSVESDVSIPEAFTLMHNYPNPFNNRTVISYTLNEDSDITLDIYDLLGRKVSALVSEYQKSGEYQIVWDADNMASGVYFYKLSTNNYTAVRMMTLLK